MHRQQQTTRCAPAETREVSLDVLNVVEFRSEWVVDVNDENLPVGLALVKQGHDAEDLDLLDLTGVAYSLTDLTDVERIIVAIGLGFGMGSTGVFPGLTHSTVTGEPSSWDTVREDSLGGSSHCCRMASEPVIGDLIGLD